ncbi:neuromedin-U receptor 2-like [Saccoglossus kowalevskii]|uniref:Neuromedin-U receptor 2-like n=1 Tax=Saccoglossus kowalevskii TaxID=10224 RepID=A0ABM0GVN7_SACKO|nr:PREDICTED: neuromedin-U receptor 2-like [Saccoglossus kowalevskii]
MATVLEEEPTNSTMWSLYNATEDLGSLQAEYKLLNDARLHSREPLACVWLTILVAGLFGNVAFLYVRARVSYMKTVTNCYLMNLGLADIMFLAINVPLETCDLFYDVASRFQTLYCVLSSGVTHLSNYTSMLTLALITMERYFAICKPFQAERLSSKSRARRVIAIAWAVALAFAVIFTISCFSKGGLGMNAITLILQTLPFIVSMSTITVLNVLIVGQLSNRNHAAMSALESSARAERLQVIRLLIVTELLFFICVFPYYLVDFIFGAQVLSNTCVEDTQKEFCMSLTQLYALMVSMKTSMYVNAAINPLIYNVMSSRYRQAFLFAFKCRKQPISESVMYASTQL